MRVRTATQSRVVVSRVEPARLRMTTLQLSVDQHLYSIIQLSRNMSLDQSRKRKRHTEGERLHNKQSSAFDETEVAVSYLSSSHNTVIVDSLSLPASIDFQAYGKGGANAFETHNELLLRSSSHSTLNYTVRNETRNTPTDRTKHYVGIYDPDNDMLQLVETRHANLRSTLKSEEEFLLKQRVDRDNRAPTARRALGLEFGTKKARKAIAQSADNKISSSERSNGKTDSAAKALLSMLDATAQDASPSATLTLETNASRVRPKNNALAERVEDAYTIEDVVGEDMMLILKVKPWVDVLQNGGDVPVPSRFVSKRIKYLAAEDDISTLKLCKYIVVLINFLEACTFKGKPVMGGQVPTREVLREKIEEPDSVINKLIERFTASGTFTMMHLYLVRTTLAVLTLMVDKFETDTHDLREDIGLKDIKVIYELVGAKVKPLTASEKENLKLTTAEAGVHSLARLTLPMEFPKPRTTPRSRR